MGASQLRHNLDCNIVAIRYGQGFCQHREDLVSNGRHHTNQGKVMGNKEKRKEGKKAPKLTAAEKKKRKMEKKKRK